MTDFSQKITANLKTVLKETKSLCLKYPVAPVDHCFIYALLKNNLSVKKSETEIQLSPDKIFSKLKSTASHKKTNAIDDIMLKAFALAARSGHHFVGAEHCLSVILEKPEITIKPWLTYFQIDISKLQEKIQSIMRGNSKMKELGSISEESTTTTPADAGHELLNFFTTDLTDNERQRSINPVINRDNEIARLIQILCRKDKNNPIILGAPGVGKTALVEGLAKKILNQEVPGILQNKKVLTLDLGSLVAGTMYRGDFENRIKAVVEEIKSRPDIILFIDEIHNLIGAGSSTGTLDAANLLKPLLARGEIRCIGATTHDEFKKFIEKDAALERRFQPLILDEPSAIETRSILEGVKDNYEKYHGVTFLPEALEAAVTLAAQYMPDKIFPDKAIDLLDEAAADLKIANYNLSPQRQLDQLEKNLLQCKYNKDRAVREEKYDLAIKYKQKEIIIRRVIKAKKTELEQDRRKSAPRVAKNDIIKILAAKTRIPEAELSHSLPERITHWEKALKDKIFGQDQVLVDIISHLRKSYYGLRSTNGPLASFLFCGPSGCGKTFTAKLLASTIFHHPDALIRIDMSEFGEKHNLSKLIGAPAGYVGYREGNKLTDGVKNRPYSLILFDEVDKAHPDVLNILLQILDEGHLTDSTGRPINFRQTIIIMTTNVGADHFHRNKRIGFDQDKDLSAVNDRVHEELKKSFKQELLNRLDKVLYFQPLSDNALLSIIDQEIKEKQKQLDANGFNLNIDAQWPQKMLARYTQKEHGARGLRRIVEDEILKIITP